MNYCPCCSDQLLRHIRSNEIHWFCRSCWQDMPAISGQKCILACQVSESVVRKLPMRMESGQGTRNGQWAMVLS
ncbi:hypothetical protein [Scytonema hofmannii]|uniref:hypothetical protein n=1 Tax=Scytonema hofmannii TaxID=34078 RepID=UPI0009D7700F|nr:hypothetical protein [Scytonema hofmannii]